MDVAALAISLVALGIAALSAWFTYRSDRREELAHVREESRDERAIREQQRNEERARLERQARLSVTEAGSEGGSTHPERKLYFTVYNAGPAPRDGDSHLAGRREAEANLRA